MKGQHVAPRAAPRNASTAKLLSVYDGQRCLGFVLARGNAGYEAFDADEKSLGVFVSTTKAAAAISAKEAAA